MSCDDVGRIFESDGKQPSTDCSRVLFFSCTGNFYGDAKWAQVPLRHTIATFLCTHMRMFSVHAHPQFSIINVWITPPQPPAQGMDGTCAALPQCTKQMSTKLKTSTALRSAKQNTMCWSAGVLEATACNPVRHLPGAVHRGGPEAASHVARLRPHHQRGMAPWGLSRCQPPHPNTGLPGGGFWPIKYSRGGGYYWGRATLPGVQQVSVGQI